MRDAARHAELWERWAEREREVGECICAMVKGGWNAESTATLLSKCHFSHRRRMLNIALLGEGDRPV